MEDLDRLSPEERASYLDYVADLHDAEIERVRPMREFEARTMNEEDRRLIARIRASGVLDLPEPPPFKDPDRPTREEVIARSEWRDANPCGRLGRIALQHRRERTHHPEGPSAP